jgi:hypothetical protein
MGDAMNSITNSTKPSDSGRVLGLAKVLAIFALCQVACQLVVALLRQAGLPLTSGGAAAGGSVLALALIAGSAKARSAQG